MISAFTPWLSADGPGYRFCVNGGGLCLVRRTGPGVWAALGSVTHHNGWGQVTAEAATRKDAVAALAARMLALSS